MLTKCALTIAIATALLSFGVSADTCATKNKVQHCSIDTNAATATFPDINTLYRINDDMFKPGEGLPEGVPTNYDWYRQGRLGDGNDVKTMKVVNGWAQTFYTKGVKQTTDRVQFKNNQFLVCYGSPHKWMLMTANHLGGYQYPANELPDPGKDPYYWTNTGGVDTIGFDANSVFHFWQGEGHFTIPGKPICGYLNVLQAKTITSAGQVPTVPNKFLVGMGADYWSGLNTTWDQNYVTNYDIGVGSFEFIQPNWKWHGLSTASDADLQLLLQNGYDVGKTEVNGNI